MSMNPKRNRDPMVFWGAIAVFVAIITGIFAVLLTVLRGVLRLIGL